MANRKSFGKSYAEVDPRQNDLRNRIMRELGLPADTEWFTVEFSTNGDIDVVCKFRSYPDVEPEQAVDEPLHDIHHGGLNG